VNLTIKQILNSKEILSKLANQKMSAASAYKVQRNISKLNPEFVHCEVTITSLINKYAEKNKLGEFIISEKNKEEYTKEITEFLNSEIEIDILQIKVDDINFEFTPFEIMAIDWMLI